MAIYEINNQPTVEKINKYNEQDGVYFRFQNKDWEMGTQSWGMIYDSAEEALEDDSTVLDGKSCCSTSSDLLNFSDYFDKDFRVIVMTGDYVEEDHDGEDVVDVAEIIEVWGYQEFCKLAYFVKYGEEM